MDRATVIAFRRGWAEAAKFMERERMIRLASLTPEEARQIYDDLCHLWEQTAQKEGWPEALERLKMESLVARRRTFDLLGETQKSEQAI
ncbi:MAG: hypothetical protein ACUVV0_12415 [Anaerolineae bacterium]